MLLVTGRAPRHLALLLSSIHPRAEFVYLPEVDRWAVMTRLRVGSDEGAFRHEFRLPDLDPRTRHEAVQGSPRRLRMDPCIAILPRCRVHYNFRYVSGRRMLEAHDAEILDMQARQEEASIEETTRTGADVMGHVRRKCFKHGVDITPSNNVARKHLEETDDQRELRELMERRPRRVLPALLPPPPLTSEGAAS